MDKGYIENGFIVDVSNARKTSEIIYELSRILDLPDAQSKRVCLKLGSVDLSATELTSIKALVESMNSEIEFINTSSEATVLSAEELGIEVSVLENKVPLPEFNADQEKVNVELERALDKIFGDENNPIQTFAQEKDLKELKKDSPAEEFAPIEETVNNAETIETPVIEAAVPETINEAVEEVSNKQEAPVVEEIQVNNDYDELEDFNSELENANSIEADEIDFTSEEVQKCLRETEKLPTLYIQRTLRSGQSITSDGNLVIIGDVNPGSEIIAKGDMIAIPGDTKASTIAGIIADESAIGMVNQKTTAVRLIPVIGKGVGEVVEFGGLLGYAPIMPVNQFSCDAFVQRGGRIPAPIHSFKN